MAYKFNYTRATNVYHWRAPFEEDKANHQEGFETKAGKYGDDKGSYLYGTKELWYNHSIESKNFIAEFSYSDAKSGYGVKNEHGGIWESVKPQRLDKLTLYSREDRKKNGANATPIKTVHFQYTYDLCPGIPNNPVTNGGKLTLSEVYFTYGKSHKARLSSYRFAYGDYDHDGTTDSDYNPSYHPKANDCWGNYMEAPANCATGDLPSWKFPYINQGVIPSNDASFYDSNNPDRTYADAYAAAWTLSQIKLPTGGIIDVHYESKDYAYVQDRPAMEMFKLTGAGANKNATPSNELFDHNKGMDYSDNSVIFVTLPQAIADDSTFEARYLKDLVAANNAKELYFNCRIAVNAKKEKRNGSLKEPRVYEHISGYAEIEDAGLVGTNSTTAWIKLKKRGLKGKDDNTDKINPISYRAWSFIRANLSELIFEGSDPKGTGESAIKGLVGFADDIKTMFRGFHKMLLSDEFANEFVPGNSWVRLYSPYGNKKGGGARVAKVTLADNWQQMSGGKSATYGQAYDYTIERDGEIISSGVAANEPTLGRDQNPMIQPKRYLVRNPLHQNDEVMLDGPMGEMYMPAPQIVFSRVKVQDLQDSRITRSATGYSVKEFYTAKDFPVLFEETAIDPRQAPKFNINVMGTVAMDYFSGSQGYAIHLNDMHGKPKGTQVYGQGEDPISEAYYYYKTKSPYQESNKNILDNDNISVIYPDNTQGLASIGKEIEVTIDERQSSSFTAGLEMQIQADGFFIPPFFFPVGPFVSVIPSPTISKTRFRSIVLTKAVRHFGIMDSVVAIDHGAAVTTKNLAWDAETGNVLLTHTKNEFHDDQDNDVYGFSYPVHWGYDRMGPAYKNEGAEWEDQTLTQAFNSGILVKGDELMLYPDGKPKERVWVLDPDMNAAIDSEGNLYQYMDDAHTKIKVLRSGRRNMQGGSMGSITAKEDPRTNADSGKALPVSPDVPEDILSASAVEFEEIAQKLCGVPNYDCACEITQEGTDFMVLLNKLVADEEWLNTGVSLNGYTQFTQATSFLTAIGATLGGNTHTWNATVNNTSGGCDKGVEIVIKQNGSTTLATVQLDMGTSNYCLPFMKRFTNIRGVAPDSGNCVAGDSFLIDGNAPLICGDEIEWDPVGFSCETSDFAIQSCTDGWDYLCDQLGEVVNPFQEGLRGSFHPKVSYAHLTGRTTNLNLAAANPQTKIYEDGLYESFNPFWEWDGDSWEKDELDWTWTTKLSKHLAYGQDIEEVNPLVPDPIYSTALFGYHQQLPVAVAANARYHEIAYEHFELSHELKAQCDAHTWFRQSGDSLDLSSAYAHSGCQSVRLMPGDSLVMTQPVNLGEQSASTDNVPYTFKGGDCAGSFSPDDSGQYVLTLWLRSDAYTSSTPLLPSDYEDIEVTVSADGVPVSTTEKRGLIIEGWQRVEQVFSMPTTSSNIFTLKIENTATGGGPNAYVDDVRIHPFYASMKTFVYNPITLKLMAEGDDKGYCTFYQLNEQEGSLKGIKRETARGIMTLSENRSNVAKNQ